jgi:hypothetical protein
MEALLISGNTLQSWNVDDILQKELSVSRLRERITQEDWDSTIGQRCQGLTYLQVEQFDNTYNNFR